MGDAVDAKRCEYLADHQFANNINHLMRRYIMKQNIEAKEYTIHLCHELAKIRCGFLLSSVAAVIFLLSCKLGCVELVILVLHLLIAKLEM